MTNDSCRKVASSFLAKLRPPRGVKLLNHHLNDQDVVMVLGGPRLRASFGRGAGVSGHASELLGRFVGNVFIQRCCESPAGIVGQGQEKLDQMHARLFHEIPRSASSEAIRNFDTGPRLTLGSMVPMDILNWLNPNWQRSAKAVARSTSRTLPACLGKPAMR